MCIRNCWQVIAFAQEIGGTPLARTVCEEKVVLFRTRRARRWRSPTAARIGWRRCRSGAWSATHPVRLSRHVLRRRRRCVRVPGQDTVPRQARVRKYPLVERHTFAWIWLGDAARADPATIPDVHWVDDPAWAVTRLSPFRRQLSARQRQPARPLARELRARGDDRQRVGGGGAVHRHARRQHRARAPRHVQHRGAAVLQAHHRLHRPHQPLAHQQFTPPGINIIENGSMPADAKDRSAALERKVINLIVPETTTTSHYFWAIVRQFGLNDQALSDYIFEGIARTFDQDKAILEAQQREIGDDPDRAIFRCRSASTRLRSRAASWSRRCWSGRRRIRLAVVAGGASRKAATSEKITCASPLRAGQDVANCDRMVSLR